MPERDILQAANELYSDTFGKGDLPMPPGRQLAIVTCMDARLDPAKFLGLEEGDAHVIRNAGGLVTEDAIRSLIISHWLLGTQEVAVIAHTDCGMLTFSERPAALEAQRGGGLGRHRHRLQALLRSRGERADEPEHHPRVAAPSGLARDLGLGLRRQERAPHRGRRGRLARLAG